MTQVEVTFTSPPNGRETAVYLPSVFATSVNEIKLCEGITLSDIYELVSSISPPYLALFAI